MDPDWKALMPHRPLDSGDAAYVERPAESGGAIADLVLAGKSTVLVAGPVGVGKSTELAAAAQRLQADRMVCLAPLDRWENMRRITADRALLRIAGGLAQVALDVLKLALSPPLRSALVDQGVLTRDPGWVYPAPFQGSPAMLARVTVQEVTRLSPQQRVAILIDGIEKAGTESAAELFDALAALPEELDLVVVVPWSAAYGPRAPDVIRQGERLVTLRALPVEAPSGGDGLRFLLQVLARRIAPVSLPQEFVAVARLAATWSGGIPRMFLQLLADAATNSRLRPPAPRAPARHPLAGLIPQVRWPTEVDLMDAVADLRDSFRRILLPGDTEALRAVDGTDGREMPLDRKVRLLAHAALLERAGEHGPIMEPHPLVRMLLAPAPPHA